jgi:hypothetical protein
MQNENEKKLSTEIQNYLKDRYHEQLKWYDNKANINKKVFMNYQNTIIILGAAIPIISVVLSIVSYDKVATIIASCISAIIAIIAAKDKLNQPMSNWYSYRSIAENLRKEQYFFTFLIGPYKGLKLREAEEMFVERVEMTIASDISRFINSSQNTQKTEQEVIDNEVKK